MTDKNVYEILDSLFPFETQEEWDKSNIYFESFEQEIKKIGICLDATIDVVKKAINDGCNLLISHHPLYIDESDVKKPYVKKVQQLLFENKINLVSCHTNFDKSSKGTNYSLLKELNLFNIKRATKSEYAFVGELKSRTTINALIEDIKYYLGVEYVMFATNDSRILNHGFVKKICILGGAGASEIETLRKKDKIDVFITGEIKWHQWEIGKFKNISLLQVPHSIEKIFIKRMQNVLKDFETVTYYPNTIFSIR